MMLLLFICHANSLDAQMRQGSINYQKNRQVKPIQKSKLRKADAQYTPDYVVHTVDENPAVLALYKGGAEAMDTWIYENLIIPADSDLYFVQEVRVKVIIDQDGKILDPVILDSELTPETAKPIIEMISKMPYWAAAQDEKGNNVKSYQVIPVKINIH